MPKPTDDPYRTLGILRGADPDEVKAAHRRLAKRFHPDGSMGDEQRFLAVQEAYQLLSDPLRRREWDRRHAPGPMPAQRPPARPTPPRQARPARAQDHDATADREGRRPARAARPQPAPGARTTTWSAAHVPWWQDFRPRARPGDDPAATTTAPRPAGRDRRERAADAGGATPTPPGADLDVFNRSSGAAWSMAARRHFRRGDEELPSRGVWRYRGTQVVTGAEARKVAAEEAAERAAAQAARTRARQAAQDAARRAAGRHTGPRADDGPAGQPPQTPEERSRP